jgi:hypothetical protein
VQRLVLVGSGGLGPDLSASLGMATLPGAEAVLTALAAVSGGLRTGLRVVEGAGSALGWQRMSDLAEAADAVLALRDVEAGRAFLRTPRGVVDAHGQAVTALDRLYLANAVPIAGSQREGGGVRGRWSLAPPRRPDRFCAVLLDFLGGTTAAAHDRSSWRALLSGQPGKTAGPAPEEPLGP